MNQLQEKVAAVSGACSSIGRGIAIRFAREGAKTALIDSDPSKGAELVKEIEAAGGTAKFFQCDVASKSERGAIEDAVKVR